MLELVPDKSGVRVARGVLAAGLISIVLWAGIAMVPLIVL
jgi:hypothetical protein